MAAGDDIRNTLAQLTGSDSGATQDMLPQFLAYLKSMPNTDGLESDITALQSRVDNLPTPPSPSSTTPASVALDGLQGSSQLYARADHTHAARVQRNIVTLNTAGTATWTFSRPFTAEPSLQYMVFQATGEPIIVEAQSWVMTGANYTGVTIKAYRSRPLANLPALSGTITLLTGVITGVNSLVTALTGYNVFGGGALNGVRVHLSAGDQM